MPVRKFSWVFTLTQWYFLKKKKNVLCSNDGTYKNLKNLIRKSDLLIILIILRSDKDSSVVVMSRSHYLKKLKEW